MGRYYGNRGYPPSPDANNITEEELNRIGEDLQARLDGVSIEELMEKTLREAKLIPEEEENDLDMNAENFESMMTLPPPNNARGNKWRRRPSSIENTMYESEGSVQATNEPGSDGSANPQYYRTSNHRLVVYKEG